MPLDDHLGRYVTLRVSRLTIHGAALAALDAASPETVLLPRRETASDLEVGDELEVFLYLDSEDRLTATLIRPRLALGEVTFLEVVDLAPFGAFFDWGLGKELLVPGAEQIRDVRVGERHPVALVRDRSGRLGGTMRVAELLEGPHDYEVGDWVDGEAWRNDSTIGLFVILDRRRVGLLPVSEPHELRRGEAARFRVAAVLPDGKLRLSLRGLAHTHIADDAEVVWAALSRPSAPRLGDHSDPDAIRAACGLSKKAFKRAVGRLLRAGRAELDTDGAVIPRGGPA